MVWLWWCGIRMQAEAELQPAYGAITLLILRAFVAYKKGEAYLILDYNTLQYKAHSLLGMCRHFVIMFCLKLQLT